MSKDNQDIQSLSGIYVFRLKTAQNSFFQSGQTVTLADFADHVSDKLEHSDPAATRAHFLDEVYVIVGSHKGLEERGAYVTITTDRGPKLLLTPAHRLPVTFATGATRVLRALAIRAGMEGLEIEQAAIVGGTIEVLSLTLLIFTKNRYHLGGRGACALPSVES